jgi:NAD(P)H-hydrate epimerase
MLKPVTSARMRRIDSLNIDSRGIPSIILMERAGREAAKEVVKLAQRLNRQKREVRVALFCGKGNNGGDGLVCARYLLSSGINIKIYLLCNHKLLTGDPASNILALKKRGVSVYEITGKAGFRRLRISFNANIIVDSIFGIGFKGKPEGRYKEIIKFLNNQKALIVSVDVPSGLDATTGTARAAAIFADHTITFGFAKTGFYKNDGPVHCGRIRVAGIGLKR